jgi:hypothetical protein
MELMIGMRIPSRWVASQREYRQGYERFITRRAGDVEPGERDAYERFITPVVGARRRERAWRL